MARRTAILFYHTLNYSASVITMRAGRKQNKEWSVVEFELF